MYTQQLEGVGYLGRSSGQTTFDTERQKLWERFLSRDGSFYQPAASGQLSLTQTQQAAAEVKQIMDAHTALYQSLQGQVDNSWLTPRYNDYQAVFEGRYRDIMGALGRMQSGPITPQVDVTGAPVVQQVSDLSTPTQLVISGGAPSLGPTMTPTGAGVASGGGVAYGDLFGPNSGQAAPGTSFGAGLGEYLPWIAGGLALVFLTRRGK
jgi:hypothetical protein